MAICGLVQAAMINSNRVSGDEGAVEVAKAGWGARQTKYRTEYARGCYRWLGWRGRKEIEGRSRLDQAIKRKLAATPSCSSQLCPAELSSSG